MHMHFSSLCVCELRLISLPPKYQRRGLLAKKKNMKMMTHGIGATMILVWFTIMVSRARPSSAIIEVSEEQQLARLGIFPTETCDLSGSGQRLARAYSQFLARLRNRMRATMSCGIPVTRSDLPAGGEYVLAELKVGTRASVTLALPVNSLYVVAYRVRGQTSGVFFNEPNVGLAKSKLFSRLQTQRTLGYGGSYLDLLRAGADRETAELGLLELRRRVEALQRGAVSATEEAKFLVVAIQMVAEATRFRYIENLVVQQGLTKSFKPNAEMLAYENNWGKISEAVHRSQKQVPNQCVTIGSSITIGTITLRLVSDIRNDVGILKYEDNNKKPSIVGDIIVAAADGVADLEIAFFKDSLM